MPNSTIIAISTPPGNGAIGVVRISGPGAEPLLTSVWQGPPPSSWTPKHLYSGHIVTPEGQCLDEVLCFIARAPHSYTGEDLVEIQAHGGHYLLELIVTQLLAMSTKSARLAKPGEFTQRAFLHGRIDLTQAEAVADLIAATNQAGVRQAGRQLAGKLSELVGKMRRDLLVLRAQMEAMIDFPEDEDVQGLHTAEISDRVNTLEGKITDLLATYQEGRAWREGVRVAIVGKPNVGKSSLLNALLREDRSIVHESPGTTRDLVEEVCTINGLAIRLIDTAGIRQGAEQVEQEGIKRSRQRIAQADLILALFDSSRPLDQEDLQIMELVGARDHVKLYTKIDRPPAFAETTLPQTVPILAISAQDGLGLEGLRKAMVQHFVRPNTASAEVCLSHLRHKLALEQALQTLQHIKDGMAQQISLEFLASDLLIAARHLGEITGEITTDELLGEIFSKFCLGK